MLPGAVDFPPLRVGLVPSAMPTLRLDLPVLGGTGVDRIFSSITPAGRCGDLWLYRSGPWLLGTGALPVEAGVESAASRLYRDLFAAARGQQLARVWNYVPAINGHGAGELENYRAFCRGRSLAFQQEFGTEFVSRACAASAVGTDGATLNVIFAACTERTVHVENPSQIPAYRYPPQYGPRAPTFARATIVRDGGDDLVFISGTSAIRGHQTIAPSDTASQLHCTLENLVEISRACGLGGGLAGSARHFKIYLRHAAEYHRVAAELETRLLKPEDQVTYLRSDICRRELNIEIEATVRAPRPET